VTSLVPRSRLFHAIVVVGLSTAATGCGGAEQVARSKEAGADALAEATTEATAADASSEEGSFELTATDASTDSGRSADGGDAGDAARDCGPLSYPGPEGGCWPMFI